MLALGDDVYDVLNKLKNIKNCSLDRETEIVCNIFKEQSLISWGAEDVIDSIIRIIEKYPEKYLLYQI